MGNFVFLALLLCLERLSALGQSYQESAEDEGTSVLWQELFSSETTLTRRYQSQGWQRLLVDGEVNLILGANSQPHLEIRGNRALLSQINVLSFNDVLFIKLNNSLLGPREHGRLTIQLSIPELKEVEVLNGVRVSGYLGGQESQRWRVRSESQVDLNSSLRTLEIEVTWGSSVRLMGTVEHLVIKTRDSVSVDIRQLRIQDLHLQTEGRAVLWVNEVQRLQGILGQKSILNLPQHVFEQEHPDLNVQGKIQRF